MKVLKLRDALESLAGFESVYLDTPPVLNFYSQSALIAAEKCFIPFDFDSFSREALYTLIQTISEIKADHNHKLEIGGIIVNQFQKQANLPQQMVEALVAEGLPVLDSMISPSIKVRESHAASQPLVHFVPNHKLSPRIPGLTRGNPSRPIISPPTSPGETNTRLYRRPKAVPEKRQSDCLISALCAGKTDLLWT